LRTRAAFAAYSRIQRFVSQRATSNVDRGMIVGLFEMVNPAAEPRALSASLLACPERRPDADRKNISRMPLDATR
jgi:hypothetical protein